MRYNDSLMRCSSALAACALKKLCVVRRAGAENWVSVISVNNAVQDEVLRFFVKYVVSTQRRTRYLSAKSK